MFEFNKVYPVSSFDVKAQEGILLAVASYSILSISISKWLSFPKANI